MVAAISLAGTLVACGDALPDYQVEKSSLAPRQGQRVAIAVQDKSLTSAQCRTLLNRYAKDAQPDGMVTVSKPSEVLRGAPGVYCLERHQEPGVRFNTDLFPGAS